MDLKEKLAKLSHVSTKKHVSQSLIYALGLFGVVILTFTAWLLFNDWRDAEAVSSAQAEARQAADELRQPIQALKRVMADEQVKALAIRALENPDTAADLTAYLKGRISQVSSARVFRPNPSTIRPREIGPNGFAVLDMVMTALGQKKGFTQIHYVLKPPKLYDAALIADGEKRIGVLVVALDTEYLLSGFNPKFGSLGFIRLTQNNGRQALSNIQEWGDASLLGEVPERIAVPGSLFRIEFPLQEHVGLLGGWTALLMTIAGILSLLGSFVFYQGNRIWQKADLVAKARKSSAPAQPSTAEQETNILTEAPSIRDSALRKKEEHTPQGDSQFDGEPVAAPAAAIPDPPPMHLHYDITERRRMREAEHSPVELSPEIFRAYDIRGVIDKTLDSGVARNVGQAVGTVALEKDAGPVVVARDGRLSGPYLMEGMIEGIVSTGCDVLDIGAVPTGVLYFAAHEFAAGSGVMITGSHNPPDYNGFKIMVGGDTLHGVAISNLYSRIKAGELQTGQGSVTRTDVVPDYIQKIASDIKVERDLKVVIDCGNGIGGVCAAETLRAIGVEVLPMFDEVDGTFPNHHPDPSDPENLVDLIESVRLMDADLGLALDGDADRLGVVTLAGDIIFPDRIMMLLALDVLDRKPGATIIYDVKCTGHLPKVIREAGGNPVMYKTGHSLIKARMKEIDSPFAGEMSGHFFFGERWYGVDDGIYAAARLLEILGNTEAPPEAILNALPTSFSTPELKVQMQEGENHEFIEAFKAVARFEGAEINTIDGLRADFEDGWGLVRASNTTPILVVRFDAETEQALERIKNSFRAQMLQVRQDLDLPF